MANALKAHPLLILDFGSQYTQLIARRLRDLGIYCEIYPYTLEKERFELLSPCGIILSGGASTVTVDETPRAPDWVFSSNLPVLGICYGMQTMALQLGGQVSSSSVSESGYAALTLHGHSTLLDNIQDHISPDGRALLDVWMSHGDSVTALPEGFKIIASTPTTPIAAMADESRSFYGVQFHPEVTHTTQGGRILERFAVDICKAHTDWTPLSIMEETISSLRSQLGTERVLLGLSGGVDSAVVAVLLHKAIGDRLECVFVDTGLLRQGESEQLKTLFSDHMGISITYVNAQERFLEALHGVECPETKRKIIGRLFIEVFEEEARRHSDVQWLAQGTIYSDVIESAATHTGSAATVIKSHHNVGGLPDTLKLKLIEPVRMLFKDEVRNIGLELGLPYDVVHRHPFPGPGLGVRILGQITPEFASILQKADAIFMEELHKAGLYHRVSQAFAVFLPVKSVGVVGDGRRYGYTICLRAVETVDFMTAHWAQLPWDFLGKVSNRIVNEISQVSRVTYDITGKPPATIEWE